jgi:hypothetical protein
VLLNTFRDRQTAYVFAVNPLGTQSDARVVNDGRTTDVTWDAEWKAGAQRQEWGWSAEMAIPLASMRFQAGEDQSWGVNFGRGRRRSLDLSFWTGPLDAEFRVSQAGTVTGLDLPRPPSRHTGILYGLTRFQDGAEPSFSVARVQRDIGRSSVGLNWADRRLDGAGDGSVEIDATLFFSPTLGLTGQVARSYGPGEDGVWAFFLRPSYDSPTGHVHVRYTHLGENFADNANGIGFITDDNRREVDSAIERTFWLSTGVLERLRYGSNYNAYWGQEGDLGSWKVDESLDADFRSRWSASLAHSEEFKGEYLPRFEKDFRNRSTTPRVGYNTPAYQSLSAGCRFGKNFDADFKLVSGSVR